MSTQPESRASGAAVASGLMAPRWVGELVRYIHQRWGLSIDDRRREMLERRLSKRMVTGGFPGLEAYAHFLLAEGGMASEGPFLIDAVTTHTTHFFREADHFRFLVETLLPDFLAEMGHAIRPFRCWSAACSNGQEAYSLAMVLHQARRTNQTFDYEVLASDISEASVARTRHGVYAAQELDDIPPAFRDDHVLQGRGRMTGKIRMAPHLRSRIRCSVLNLADTSYRMPSHFDLIVLRNCLIYFDPSTQLRVISQLRRHLRTGGHLITGHVEHFEADRIGMTQVKPSVYRKDRQA